MKYFAFIFLFLVSLSASAETTEIAGKNLSEKRIRWVWQNLSTVLFSCSQDKDNCGNPKYQALISQLLKLVPSESDFDVKAWQSQLIFKHENEFDFNTDLEESHRVAMTGLTPGSIIYFNLDRIERSQGVPYDYEFYVGILVHELVHHLGITDTNERWPDQIGSYIATYFKSKFLSSAQGMVSQKNVSLNVFNAEGPMHWSAISSEIDDRLFNAVPAQSVVTLPCDNAWDMVIQQKVEKPRWHISQFRLKEKTMTLNGTAIVHNQCGSVMTGLKNTYPKKMLLTAVVQFIYPQEMNATNWDKLTPTVQINVSHLGFSTDDDLIKMAEGLIFTLKPISLPHKTAEPGTVLNYEFEVEDSNQLPIDGCMAQLTSEDWPWVNGASPVKTISASRCSVIKVDKSRHKVSVSYQVPHSVVTLNLQLYNVTLYSKDKFYLSYPSRPVVSQINGNAQAGQTSMDVTFKNLQPLSALGDYPLINSYVANESDQFQVQLQVQTQDELLRADFEVLILVREGETLGSGPYGGPMHVDKLLIQNYQKTLIGSITDIVLNYKIPNKINSVDCYGMKFNSFSVLTSQLEQISVTYPQTYESFVISPRLLQ